MIWATLAMFVVSFVLTALLAPKPKLEDARAQSLDDLNFPQAAQGSPVAWSIGQNRITAPNTLWYGDFRADSIEEKVKTGLFSSEKVTVGYRYFVGFAQGLSLGGEQILKSIWIDKNNVWNGSAGTGTAVFINKPELFGGEEQGGGWVGTFRFYGGTTSQGVNGYLDREQSGEAVAFTGQSYGVWEQPYVGNSASLRAISFEVEWYPNSLGISAGRHIVGNDSNLAEILFQIMTSQFGGLGLSPNDIDQDSFRDAADTLHGEGNGASMLVTRPNDGKGLIQEVLRQMDGVLYQDPQTGQIVLALVRADYDALTIPELDESTVQEVRQFKRTAWADTFNQVRVLFGNRANKYQTGAMMVHDAASISAQQKTRSTDISFPMCRTSGVATALATRELAQLSVPLYQVSLVLNRTVATMRPGDVFRFSWADYGIEEMIMRVQRFSLGDLLDGRIVIEASQDIFAVNEVVFAVPPDPDLYDWDRPAIDMVETRMFEVPAFWINQSAFLAQQDGDDGYLWMVGEHPDTTDENQLGYIGELVSPDTLTLVNRKPYTNTVLLGEALTDRDAFDDGVLDNLLVKTPTPDGSFLVNSTPSAMRTGVNVFIVGLEIMAFETFTDNLNGTYTLHDVRRALLDTTFLDHSINDVAYFLNVTDGIYPFELDMNSTVYSAKALSYTDKEVSDTLTAPSAGHVGNKRATRPVPPMYVELNGSRIPAEITTTGGHSVSWVERNRLDSSIRFQTDATVPKESGAAYTVRYYLNGLLQTGKTQAGVSGTSTNITFDAGSSGTAKIAIHAVRDGVESQVSTWVDFSINIP